MTFPSADLAALERTLFLCGPLAAVIALVLIARPTPREATAALVGFLWQLPALLLIQLVVTAFGWWRFADAPDQLLGLPISLWIGWALWWGALPALALRYLHPAVIVALAVLADVVSMPLVTPMVILSDSWLWGEGVALVIGLLPGLTASELTRSDRHPQLRSIFHVLGWGGYLMLVIPAAVLAYEGRSYFDFLRVPVSALDWSIALLVLLLLFIGVAATMEFAVAGQGTPIPFDPPKRVVTTGPYAFVANPMQIISALAMLLLAAYARSWGLLLIAVMFAVFDAIYAHWYNTAHIARAKPEWARFSDAVPLWNFRWRPFVDGEAEVAISRDGPARWIWDNVWRRIYRGQAVRERPLEPEDGMRLRYRRHAAGIDETGVIAAARVLEHGPLPLAMLGWLMRFIGIGAVLQIVAGLAIRWYRRGQTRP